MRIRVELYGRLKDAGLGRLAEIEVTDGASASTVLSALGARLGAQSGLLEGAALSTGTEVLALDAPVPSKGRLAALPPVCGG